MYLLFPLHVTYTRYPSSAPPLAVRPSAPSSVATTDSLTPFDSSWLPNFKPLKAALLVAMELLRSKAATLHKVDKVGKVDTLLRDSNLVLVAT
jgi:hypothetical protein